MHDTKIKIKIKIKEYLFVMCVMLLEPPYSFRRAVLNLKCMLCGETKTYRTSFIVTYSDIVFECLKSNQFQNTRGCCQRLNDTQLYFKHSCPVFKKIVNSSLSVFNFSYFSALSNLVFFVPSLSNLTPVVFS
jgi:hypothetical protein